MICEWKFFVTLEANTFKKHFKAEYVPPPAGSPPGRKSNDPELLPPAQLIQVVPDDDEDEEAANPGIEIILLPRSANARHPKGITVRPPAARNPFQASQEEFPPLPSAKPAKVGGGTVSHGGSRQPAVVLPDVDFQFDIPSPCGLKCKLVGKQDTCV